MIRFQKEVHSDYFVLYRGSLPVGRVTPSSKHIQAIIVIYNQVSFNELKEIVKKIDELSE